MTTQIAIAGAGALGLTAALALADAGFSVSVYDPAGAAGNASSVAAGLLAPAFESVFDSVPKIDFDLLLRARNLWPSLEARLGIVVDRAGAAAIGDAAFLHRSEVGLRALGLSPTRLARRTLEALAPGLGGEFREGVLSREDWRIEPARMMAALTAALQAKGVAFQARAATGFEGAQHLVIATGAGRDLAVLAPGLAWLTPIKGQLVRFQSGGEPGIVLRAEGAYAAAGGAGWVLGATMEPGRTDRRVEAEALEPILAQGRRLFPSARNAQFTAQAGVRAATPDGLPMVGRSAHPGVLLAVGARRNGWLLAPLVAQMIVDCVLERDLGVFSKQLDPLRY